MKMQQFKNNHGEDDTKETLGGQVPSGLRLWTKKEAAHVLHVEVKTLDNWRTQGRGPCFVRLGGPRGRILYRESDLQKYIEAAVRRSTSDTGNQEDH